MAITNLKIGDYGYPIDNSYSFNITDNKESEDYLAGWRGEEAKKVKIISEPYYLEVIFSGKHLLEFVDVEYKNKKYRVLNRFHNSEASMLRRVMYENLNEYDDYIDYIDDIHD
jgi:hypothetical protein